METDSDPLILTTCCECRIRFAMPKSMKDALVRDHSIFFCPNGHKQYFQGPNDTEKELKEAKKSIEFYMRKYEYHDERINTLTQNYETEKRRRAALQGVITRMKKGLNNA